MEPISAERFEKEMKLFEGLCNKALTDIENCIINSDDLKVKDKLIAKKVNFTNFINYVVNETNFISAPCSTKYHLCVVHGLLIHSNSVTKTLIKLNNTLGAGIPLYKCIISGLFHDLGKYDDYEPNTEKNKYYAPFVFSQSAYSEHEQQSAYLLMKYDLLDEEDFIAILSHNSPWDGVTKCNFKQNKLMTLLQMADYWSTLYCEDRLV